MLLKLNTIKSRCRRAAPHFLLVICAIGTFAAFFSNGSTNVALPALRTTFGITVSQSTIIVVSFSLICGILTLPLGRLGDLIGYKKMYVGGQAMVFIGSLLTGLFSFSLITLVCFRAVMAVGCAMVQAVTQALLQRSYPADQRGKIMGINSACLSACGLLAPLIGGLIIDWLHWRGIFLILVPFSALALILSWIYMEDFEGRRVSVDYAGALLLMLFLTALMLLFNGRVLELDMGLMAVFGGISVAALILFIFREKKAKEPLLELDFFRCKGFLIGNLGFLAGYGVSGILQVSLTYYISYTRGYSSTVTSLFVMIHGLMMTLMASGIGALSDKIGTKRLCVAGMLCQLVGITGYQFIGPTSGDVYLILCLVMFGFGSGLFYAPATSMVMGSIPPENGGLAAGMVSTMRNIAAALGNTVFSIVIASRTPVYAARNYSEALSYVCAMKDVLKIAVAAVFIALCLFLYLYVSERRTSGAAGKQT